MVCELHKKQYCRECNHGFCEHGKHKQFCRECGGSGLCRHGKRKYGCIECGGSSTCTHGVRKSTCRECYGSAFCSHGVQKYQCRKCSPSSFCPHERYKYYCRECNPDEYFTQLIRISIHRVFRTSNLPKNEPCEYYVGCSFADFKTYLVSKMTKDMTIDNVHMDHIKPVTSFNLDDLDELKKCCHYTNIQPLLVRDNIVLGNKWTEENEAFWNKNIIYNPNFLLIYKN